MATVTAVLASGYYRVRYTYPGSSFEATSTDLGAYSADEAAERVRSSVVGKDVTILSVTQERAGEVRGDVSGGCGG